MRRTALIAFCLCAWIGSAQQPTPGSPKAAPASYQVTGVVVNAVTSEIVADATVTLGPTGLALQRMPANRPESRVVRAGRDGTFAFSNVPPGKYTLSAERRGFAQQAYEQHEQFSSAIVVGQDKQSTGIVFRLQPDASLSGAILDDHNEPVMNASVLLFRAGIENGKSGIYRANQVQSNDQGRYHFSHLRTGKYYVVVAATPWYAQENRIRRLSPDAMITARPGETNPALDVAYPLTFYPGVTDSADAEPIDIRPGQRQTADFTLYAVPSAHVRVHTAGDSPRQNQFASLVREAFGHTVLQAGTRQLYAANGVTEIAGVAPGRYLLQVRAMAPGRGEQSLLRREVDVTGDMDVNATDAPAGVNLTGVLRFEGAVPAEPVRLLLGREMMPAFSLKVSADGAISSERPIPPDKYQLALRANGYQITGIAVSGAQMDGQELQVGSDDVRLAITAAKASAVIQGFAMKDGRGLPGAMVVLVPQNLARIALYRRDQSDSDGSFTLPSIPPGTYTLVAIENGWGMEWSRPELIRQYLPAGKTVQVAVDGNYHVNADVQAAP